MYRGNIAGLIVVLTCVPLFGSILRCGLDHRAGDHGDLRQRRVHRPIAMFDVWLMLVFGVMGYIFKKLDYPLAPLVLALVLGDAAENAFRQSMLMSQGDMRIFFANRLVGTMTTLALLLLFWPLISRGIAIIRGRK